MAPFESGVMAKMASDAASSHTGTWAMSVVGGGGGGSIIALAPEHPERVIAALRDAGYSGMEVRIG